MTVSTLWPPQLLLFPKPSVSPLTPQGFTPSFAEHPGQHPSLCRLGRTRVGHAQHWGRGLRSPALSTDTTDPTTHHFRATNLLTACPLVLKSDISLDVVIKNCFGIFPASGAGKPSEIDHRGYKFPMSAWIYILYQPALHLVTLLTSFRVKRSMHFLSSWAMLRRMVPFQPLQQKNADQLGPQVCRAAQGL